MATPTLIIPGQTRSSSESGGATNLTFTRNATVVTVVSDTGTDAELPAATPSLAGVMSAAQAAATAVITSVPGGSLIGRRPGATGVAEQLDIGDGLEVSAGRIDVLGQMSVTVNELGVRLVNDEASPGNSEYYGTSAAGVKGYHPLPSLGGATDLGSARNSEEVFVTSSTGGSATIPKATGLLAGVISASDQNKLNNIAPFATANSSDATLLNRANHTGTQPPSSIAGSTTVGQALMTLANPSAIRFARINADNSVTLLDSANFRDAIAACVEDDARLSDARTPLAHTHPPTDISGSTTVGRALMTLANPGAVRYARINADNSVSLLDAAAFLAAIGGGAGSPAGAGTELQFKNGGAFGALPGSSVSGSVLTLAELRVNGGDPATGLRATSSGGITSLFFFGTGTNGFFYGQTGSTNLNYRGSGFRIEGLGGSDAATFQIGITARIIFRPRALNNTALGPADAASPAAQTLSVQSASGTNQSAAAAPFSIDGAQGTGSGNGGSICIRTAPAGSAGSTPNGFVDTLTARPAQGITVSNGNFAAAGDCIGEFTVLRGSTSGTTPVILSQSALGGGMPIPLNTVLQAIVLVQGMSEAGEVARYARQVCVKNVAGTSTLQSSAVTVGADDSGTTLLNITVSDATDTLDIEVTGTAGNNWRWNAVIFGGELVRNV